MHSTTLAILTQAAITVVDGERRQPLQHVVSVLYRTWEQETLAALPSPSDSLRKAIGERVALVRGELRRLGFEL